MDQTNEVVERRFRIPGPVDVRDRAMTKLALVLESGPETGVRSEGGSLHFDEVGWYEVLLQVAWDPAATAGTRFVHSKVPGQQPLHSEAIDATVLGQISDGRQLLRGNTVFGHDHTSDLVLECWQDSGGAVRVLEADLVVRELQVPWQPA
jgi:hypothetical protein